MSANRFGKVPWLARTLAGAALVLSVVAAASAADTDQKRETEIQTGQGPVKGTLVSPKNNPGDSAHAQPPIRIFVPEHPIDPPHPGREPAK